MDIKKEFRRRVFGLGLAIIKGLTPVSALTQPLAMPEQNAHLTYMTAIMPLHMDPNVRLTALYHKSLLEQARFNAYCDTYSSMTLNGNAITEDRPRRRPSHTDKRGDPLII